MRTYDHDRRLVLAPFVPGTDIPNYELLVRRDEVKESVGLICAMPSERHPFDPEDDDEIELPVEPPTASRAVSKHSEN